MLLRTDALPRAQDLKKKALRKSFGRGAGFELRLEPSSKAFVRVKDLVPSRRFECELEPGPRAEVLEQGSETRYGPKVRTVFGPFFALGSAGLLIYSQGHHELFRADGFF